MTDHSAPNMGRREAAKRIALLSAGVAQTGRPPAEPQISEERRGARSPFEARRLASGTFASTTPLQLLDGTITPSDLHYQISHSAIPAIDPARYQLLVHGLVDRPTTFGLDDLRRLPSETRVCFLECSGNYRRNAPPTATPETMCGLLSQSEWTGVPLRAILREVGAKPNAQWLLAEGGDDAGVDRSIPVEKALDDVLVAYAQNGEPLRPAQGYPVRLIVPGWEGNVNIKWLRRLKLGAAPFMTRWETSRYSDGLRDGHIRQFSFVIDARSIITSPAPPSTIARGWNRITGLAWTGRGRIRRVEISTDNGVTWRAAELQGPALSMALTRFSAMWKWEGAETVIMSRAIDETDYRQPTLTELLAVRGTQTGPYHINAIVAWRLTRSGVMEFRSDEPRA